VNLDKFLSVVEKNSNFTPQHQLNGRLAQQGINHLYKPGEEQKTFNATNLTVNHSRNVDRKKLGSMRLGQNATDIVFA